MKLKVYDFDDTLAVSSGIIKLHRGGEERVYLSHEFVGYSPESGDTLCFSDLNHLTKVRLVLSNWREISEDHSCPNTDVLIVTSRPPGASSAIEKLLSKFGMSVEGVHAVGSGNPMDKVSVIDRAMSRRNYKYAKFIDDNPKMVKAVESFFHGCGVCDWSAVHHPHDLLTECNLSEELGDFKSDAYGMWRQTVG